MNSSRLVEAFLLLVLVILMGCASLRKLLLNAPAADSPYNETELSNRLKLY
ncbi:MAG: hypothetical protein NZ108_00050 [Bacteroidia bacterium]|nr:hypothetical protein [Bacteroidia bacterium]